MAGIRMVAWAEARRRPIDVAVLVLVVALVTGVVLGAAAGARRTSTVLDRFLAASGTADVTIGIGHPSFAADADAVLAVADEMARFDGVDRVAVVQQIPSIGLTERDMSLITGPDDGYWEMLRPVLLAGRRPSPERADEIMLSEAAADELAVGTGDRLVVPTFPVDAGASLFAGRAEEDVGEPVELPFEVVGIYRDVGGFRVDAPPDGLLSPAGARHLETSAAFSAGFLIQGDVADSDLAAIFAVATEAVPDGEHWGEVLDEELDPVRRSFDSLATGLMLFAVVGAAAGVIALGHAIARHVALSESIASVMSTLGAPRRDIAAAAAAPAIAATLVGGLLGVVVAIASSSFFPISAARPAEIDPGIAVDRPVMSIGVSVAVVVGCSIALVAAWRQTERASRERRVSGSVRRSRTRRFLPAPVAVGMGFVLDRDRSGRGVRAGPALAGAIFGVAGVVGIAVFTVSQGATADDPDRYGWTWDAMPDLFTDEPMEVVGVLVDDPRLAAVGGLSCDVMEVDEVIDGGCSLFVASGTIEFTYLDGRSPMSPDEVALARTTMAIAGVDIGESVSVRGESGVERSLVVVGEVVMPGFEHAGRGLILSQSGFDELSVRPNQGLLLTYDDDVDRASIEASLQDDYPLGFPVYAHAEPPQQLGQLGRLRPTLMALGLYMGVLGVIGLSHYLLLSVGRRGRDLAVLGAIGFVRPQIRAVVRWQALTIVLGGVLIGVPLGIIVGRWAWIAAVDEIGIVETPTLPWTIVVAVVAIALLGASVLSAAGGRWATHRRMTDALRAE